MAKVRSQAAAKEIQSRLRSLNGTSSSIEASALMSRDGFPVASALAREIDPERLGAVSASLLSLAQKTSTDLGRGELEQVLIHGTEGFVLMFQVGKRYVLSVVSKPDSKLGMLLVDTKRVAGELAELLD